MKVSKIDKFANVMTTWLQVINYVPTMQNTRLYSKLYHTEHT